MESAARGAMNQNPILPILDSAFGTELLQYMQEPEVVDILLNPDGRVWVDRLGAGLSDTGILLSAEAAERIIYLIASSCDQICNAERPIVSAKVPGTGHRFEGQLPPAVPSPTFAIRKHASALFTLESYVEAGIMSAHQRDYIVSAVHAKKNFLIVGGTGSGKTTLARSILAEIQYTGDRLAIVEDTPELQCESPNVIYLRSVPGSVDMTQQLRSALRMRPDRFIFGELRGAEAEALLDAWNTGHPGGITTAHANSALEGLARMEALLRKAGIADGKQLVAEAVDVVVCIQRDSGGRKVREVQEVSFNGSGYRTKQVAESV